jgi:hypothetical protein
MATTAKQSGFLIQSTFGTKGNFEMVVPKAGGGLSHFWRNNDFPGFPWSGGFNFGIGAVTGAALIQSNFGPGNFEVVAVVGNQLVHYWRENHPPFTWHGPSAPFATGITGNPTLIQGSFGTKGNFEVVVARTGGGLSHYWRNNDAPGFPWSGPTNFGSGNIRGVSLIQSNFGPGNLEVVALTASNQLVAYWRDHGPFTWHGPSAPFANGVTTYPSLIQSSFGTKGNFEVVVPCVPGGLAAFWRNNDAGGFPWSGPTPLPGGTAHHYTMASLIQSNFGPGNFEVDANHVSPGSGFQYWRDLAFVWHGPSPSKP